MKKLFAFLLATFALSSTFLFASCNQNGGSISGGEVSGGGDDRQPLVPQEIQPSAPREIDYRIIDLDPDATRQPDSSFDDSVKYAYTDNYVAAQGNFAVTTEGGAKTYVSTTMNTMYVNPTGTDPFPYGTISCKVKSKNTCDSGVVFGYNSSTVSAWEGAGVNYYFYFVGQGGYAYLGEVLSGSWRSIRVQKLSTAVDENHYYEVKVVFRGDKILCYLDGQLQFAVRDENKLVGTGYGFRTGGAGVEFKDVSVTSNYLY